MISMVMVSESTEVSVAAESVVVELTRDSIAALVPASDKAIMAVTVCLVSSLLRRRLAIVTLRSEIDTFASGVGVFIRFHNPS